LPVQCACGSHDLRGQGNSWLRTERSQVDQDPLVSRLAQAVKEFGESRPLTWRVCHAFRDVVGADGASITFENSSMARVTICATDQSAELLEDLQDV
jgi:hypothetical protein